MHLNKKVQIKNKKTALVTLLIIVVMLVLGAITLNTSLGKNGIFTKIKAYSNNDTIGTYFVLSNEGEYSNISIAMYNESGFKEIVYPNNEMTLTINNKTKIGMEYKISAGNDYYITVKNNNGSRNIELVNNTCVNINETTNDAYPMATKYGIKAGKIISLSSPYSGTIQYSLDGRKTWKDYNKPIVLFDTTTIYAKIEVANLITRIEEKQIIINYAPDALPTVCYDGNQNTESALISGNYKLYIDEEVYGTPLIFNGYTTNYWQGHSDKIVKLDFYLKDGTTVNIFDNITRPNVWTDLNIIIPQNSDYLQFTATDLYALNIKDISLDRTPKFVEAKQHTKLTAEGFEDAYTNLTINYYQSDTTRLYKIENGAWQNYQDTPIRTEVGQTVYAKGIDKNGVENTSQITIDYAPDALPKECYDKNQNTERALTHGNYKLYITEEMHGKVLEFSGYTTNYWQGHSDKIVKLDFYLKDGTTVNIFDNITSPKTWTNFSIVIPQNVNYLQFTATDSYALNIKDIKVSVKTLYLKSDTGEILSCDVCTWTKKNNGDAYVGYFTDSGSSYVMPVLVSLEQSAVVYYMRINPGRSSIYANNSDSPVSSLTYNSQTWYYSSNQYPAMHGGASNGLKSDFPYLGGQNGSTNAARALLNLIFN